MARSLRAWWPTLLCAASEFHRDRLLDGVLPRSRYTVTEPAPDKWLRHADLINPALSVLADRAERFVSVG